MADNKKILVTGLKETQDAVLFIMALAKVIEIVEDYTNTKDEITDSSVWIKLLSDFPSIIPVFTTLAAALEGAGDIDIELRAATKDQLEQLKTWIGENVPDLEDDKKEQFIKDVFAAVINIWVVINTYFLKKPDVPTEGTAPVSNEPVPSN